MSHIRFGVVRVSLHKLNRIEYRYGHRNCLFKSIVTRSILSQKVFSVPSLSWLLWRSPLVLCSIPMGIFHSPFSIATDASRIIRWFDLFMFFFSLQFSNSRVQQTARRPSPSLRNCRMEISRGIRRCWKKIENISSTFSNNYTTTRRNMISICRDEIKSKTSNRNPSHIHQTPKISITMSTLKMTEMKWKWTTKMTTKWMDQVNQWRTMGQATESARNGNDEFCFQRRKHSSWNGDSVSNATCQLQNVNISLRWFDWRRHKSKSGSRTIDTRQNVQRTRKEWIITSTTKAWMQRIFHRHDESLCQC